MAICPFYGHAEPPGKPGGFVLVECFTGVGSPESVSTPDLYECNRGVM